MAEGGDSACDSMAFWTAYRSIRVDSWGPLRLIGSAPLDDLSGFVEVMQRFMDHQLPDGCRPGMLIPGETYHVADAATAAMLLHLDQEFCIFLGKVPTLYRGQADVEGWTIQASIDVASRLPDREFLRRAYGSLVFEFMLKQIDWTVGDWLPKGWILDTSPASAMARHHAMDSALIDFSVDPSVSVMFAHDQARALGADRSFVFRFDLDSLGSDLTLSFPPPPVLRSARQHGIFYLSHHGPDDRAIEPSRRDAVTISFPSASPRICEGEMLREGVLIDLMHANPLLAKIEDYVRAFMQAMPVAVVHDEYHEDPSRFPPTLGEAGLLGLFMLARDGTLARAGDRFQYRPSDEVMEEWFRLATDVLHGLFGIHYKEGKIGFHADLLDRFVDNNYVTLQIYLNYYVRIFRGTSLESLLWLVRMLNTRLLKASNGIVGVYAAEFIEAGTRVVPGEFRGASEG